MRDFGAVSAQFQAALVAGTIKPAIFADLTFASGVEHIWTGFGTIAFNGYSYRGVGTLAGMGEIAEGIEVKADGTSVTLDGIDAALYAECMTEIQTGAPATLYLGLLSEVETTVDGLPVTNITVQGYPIFSGFVDQPTVTPGPDKIAITLSLENKLAQLQRASNRRYTSADQQRLYPTDISMTWVESLNDQALVWGT